MKAFIGVKIILAEPMDELAYHQSRGQDFSGSENRAGYKVVYPDGYMSWSPKATFEEAYRQVSSGEVRVICAATGVFSEGASDPVSPKK